MLKKTLLIIPLWLLAEALIWIPYRQFIGYHNIFAAISYFLIFSAITVVLFKDIFRKLIANTKITDYLPVVASLVAHGVVYWICNTFLSEPTELIASSPASYTLVNDYFLWAKPVDILLQQLMIIVLVTKLQQNNVRLRYIILTIAIIFGAVHIESLQRMELAYALILTISATLMSVVLPYLILQVKNGYLYSFMLHVAFVDIAALLFWSVL